MKIQTFIVTLFAISLLSLVLLPSVQASEFDKKTIVTFSEPVEIPGMVLSPGTYVIKRPNGNPDIVQFLNADETQVYTTVFAVPTYRQQPTDKVEINLEERPGQSPEALKKWFYPGSTIGEEFVYPKTDRMLMARASESQTAPGWSQPSSDVTPRPAPSEPQAAISQEPVEQEPVEIAQSTQPPARQPASAAQPGEEPGASAQPGEELPQTASNLPLLGLLGMLAISLGAALRWLCRLMA